MKNKQVISILTLMPLFFLFQNFGETESSDLTAVITSKGIYNNISYVKTSLSSTLLKNISRGQIFRVNGLLHRAISNTGVGNLYFSNSTARTLSVGQTISLVGTPKIGETKPATHNELTALITSKGIYNNISYVKTNLSSTLLKNISKGQTFKVNGQLHRAISNTGVGNLYFSNNSARTLSVGQTISLVRDPKKGMGISLWAENKRTTPGFDREDAQYAESLLNHIAPNWYYTWDVHPLSQAFSNIEFYPMIQTHDPSKTSFIHETERTVWHQLQHLEEQFPGKQHSYVLLYNEPDHGQQPVPVEDGADAIKYNLSALESVSENLVSPVNAINSVRFQDSWLDSFLDIADQSVLDAMNINNKPSIAVHLYPDPLYPSHPWTYKRKFMDSAADFNDPLKYEEALDGVIQDFFSELHLIKRRYDSKIMLTEFGIADWSSLSPPPNTTRPTTNRIPRRFIVDFLKIALPELSSRDYITHYALFTNREDYGEELRTNASFSPKFDSNNNTLSSELTDVGRVYRDHTNFGKCSKGEFKYGYFIYEYFSQGCGKPVKFGYNEPGRNGWYFDRKRKQYRRRLNLVQAGDLESSVYNQNCRFIRRKTLNNMIWESKTTQCGGVTSGWQSANGVYTRTLDPKTQRTGIMQFVW